MSDYQSKCYCGRLAKYVFAGRTWCMDVCVPEALQPANAPASLCRACNGTKKDGRGGDGRCPICAPVFG